MGKSRRNPNPSLQDLLDTQSVTLLADFIVECVFPSDGRCLTPQERHNKLFLASQYVLLGLIEDFKARERLQAQELAQPYKLAELYGLGTLKQSPQEGSSGS